MITHLGHSRSFLALSNAPHQPHDFESPAYYSAGFYHCCSSGVLASQGPHPLTFMFHYPHSVRPLLILPGLGYRVLRYSFPPRWTVLSDTLSPGKPDVCLNSKLQQNKNITQDLDYSKTWDHSFKSPHPTILVFPSQLVMVQFIGHGSIHTFFIPPNLYLNFNYNESSSFLCSLPSFFKFMQLICSLCEIQFFYMITYQRTTQSVEL